MNHWTLGSSLLSRLTTLNSPPLHAPSTKGASQLWIRRSLVVELATDMSNCGQVRIINVKMTEAALICVYDNTFACTAVSLFTTFGIELDSLSASISLRTVLSSRSWIVWSISSGTSREHRLFFERGVRLEGILDVGFLRQLCTIRNVREPIWTVSPP